MAMDEGKERPGNFTWFNLEVIQGDKALKRIYYLY
jgi:hypothetical protein